MAQLLRVGSHKTTIHVDSDGFTNVVYHSTAVVRFNTAVIILDSGGWRTLTTKTRMNQASNQFNLGYYVFQKDFEWFVKYQDETHRFYDGIELNR